MQTRNDQTAEDGRVSRGYLIEGRVQGVGFRWWCTRTARRLGLRGTVRNRADGRVELHVEGPEAAVRDLESSLREGPSAARVAGVEEIEPSRDLPDGFEILR